MIQNCNNFFPILLAFGLLSGTIAAQVGGAPTESREREAKQLSDAFIDDLSANKLSKALGRVDQSWLRSGGREAVASELGRCGRPLDREGENNGAPLIAEHTADNGRTAIQTLDFMYVYQTSRKSRYRFIVEVEKGKDGSYHVAGFGCSKAHVWKVPTTNQSPTASPPKEQLR